MRCVEANQQLLFGNSTRQLQGLLEEGGEALFGVLLALPQLTVEQIAFLAQIGKDRGVAVDLSVGTRNTLFLRAGVVKARHVDVQRYPISVTGIVHLQAWTQGRRVTSNQVRRLLPDHAATQVSQLIEALPNSGRRLHGLQAQSVAEEGIVAKDFHGLKVRLPQTQQTNHRWPPRRARSPVAGVPEVG